MKTVKITQTFTGYPDGTNTSRREFTAGAELPLEDAYAELLVGKGLAAKVEPKPAASAASAKPA